MGKKGTVLDWFYIIVILFIIGITFIAGNIVITETIDSGIFADNEQAEHNIERTHATILTMDNMMVFIILGLSLFVLISSAIVWNHPAMFFISVFLLFIAITVSAVISNAWFDFYTHSGIVDYASAFQKTQFLLNKLPFYVGFMGMFALIVMFVQYNR
jgi:hypothetical protein